MSHYALALDAGGTATKGWLVAADGTVAGAARGGPGNHILGSVETVRASFQDALAGACAAAGCGPEAVVTVLAGCAGIEATGETRGPIERLLAELLPATPHRAAVGDMVVAFHGALPAGVGVVVLAGTGAVAYGRNARGEAVQVDGWGHLFGDDGSAFAVGRAALRAAAKAHDGRGETTALLARIPAALGVDSLPAAAYLLYDAAGDQRERVAAVATEVSAAARSGDAVAVRLLAEAGSALAVTAAAAVRRLDLDGSSAAVATGGSLFAAGSLVSEPFARTLAEKAPQAHVVSAALPPVGGAAKLAWAAAGVEWGQAEVARAQATQPG